MVIIISLQFVNLVFKFMDVCIVKMQHNVYTVSKDTSYKILNVFFAAKKLLDAMHVIIKIHVILAKETLS